jgi:hypothetical protein
VPTRQVDDFDAALAALIAEKPPPFTSLPLLLGLGLTITVEWDH